MIVDTILAILLLLSLGITTILYARLGKISEVVQAIKHVILTSGVGLKSMIDEGTTKVVIRDSDWTDEDRYGG